MRSVMRDCKRMAAVTLGESVVCRHGDISLGSSSSVNTLTGSLLLSQTMGGDAFLPDGRGADALSPRTESLAGSYHYEYPYLRGSSMARQLCRTAF